MKFLTLNCHSWQEKDQIEKIKKVASMIKEMQYDVIALQEVSQHKDSKIYKDNIKEDNYVKVLLDELKKINVDNYDYVWDFSHMGYDIYEEGLAILTRHKIVEKDSFYISKDKTITNYKSRKIVKATIEIDGENIDFYSCHLGWWNDETEPFKDQADTLKKMIDFTKKNFIMGDFNNDAFVRNEGYDYLLSLGLKDTFLLAADKDSGVTASGEIDGWEKSLSNKRLDLILTNSNDDIKTSKVLFNTKETIVSDHYGVFIEI